MKAALLALALLSGCARHPAPMCSTERPLPWQLGLLVQIDDPTGGGWGTPLAGGRILTAAHVAEREPVLWRRGAASGFATIEWRDERTDLAMLRTSADLVPVTIARELPEVQTEVFWRWHLVPDADPKPTTLRGRYLGMDADRDLRIDGRTHRGSSGSGVLDAHGRLIGVVTKRWKPEQKSDPLGVFCGLTVARAVYGGIPGPGSR